VARSDGSLAKMPAIPKRRACSPRTSARWPASSFIGREQGRKRGDDGHTRPRTVRTSAPQARAEHPSAAIGGRPQDVEALIRRMLSRDRARRLADVEDARDLLSLYCDGPPSTTQLRSSTLSSQRSNEVPPLVPRKTMLKPRTFRLVNGTCAPKPICENWPQLKEYFCHCSVTSIPVPS
jgi:hypothetical protein